MTDPPTMTLSVLTDREREVVMLVFEGFTSKEIARRLSLSFRTVEVHRSRVLDKTAAKNFTQLAWNLKRC